MEEYIHIEFVIQAFKERHKLFTGCIGRYQNFELLGENSLVDGCVNAHDAQNNTTEDNAIVSL